MSKRNQRCHPHSKRRNLPVAQRILEMIEIDGAGCWVWQGRKSAGYGKLQVRDKSWRAHRLAYVEWIGPIPDGLVIDHLCRNKACCNPEHLEAVTHAENCRRGPKAKLTWQQVQEIRELSARASRSDLAQRYGVTAGHVHDILHGVVWAAP